jgi:ElaB/YqjD/DUF883 family membrane-anchored ribosome-binding protein
MMTAELTTGQGTVAGRRDALVNDFKDVASDTGELVKEVSGAAGEGLARARATIKEKLCEAESRLEDARAVVADRFRYAASATDGYVKNHPWKVLGVAAAAGVVIGFLVNRR